MAEASWSWSGLRKGDPYGQGAPGKPMPAPSTINPWFTNRQAPPANAQWNPAGGWPAQGGTGQVWDLYRGLQEKQKNLPVGGSLGTEQKSFMDYWGEHTPPAGLELPPAFHGPAGRTISEGGSNMGPRMAASSGGAAGDVSPMSPWGMRSPAQAEEQPDWS